MIKVYSKINLKDSLKPKILDLVRSKFPERKIELKEIDFRTDENIKAGIKIDVDSEIIDLTLNGRLEKVLEILSK